MRQFPPSPGFILAALLATACGPRAHIPPRPVGSLALLAPATGGRPAGHDSVPGSPIVPGALPMDSDDALFARRLAPLLYRQRDEWFHLHRVVAVIHPTRRLIAYHLLWRDDVHGSWIPFTVPTDQEVVWVGYDTTGAPTDLWTYWHGTVLHTPWPRAQVVVDVQWGKHGSLPRNTAYDDLPLLKTLNSFWLATWVGLPDIWLSRLNRNGPWCFCRGYKRYREFSAPMLLAPMLDAVVRTDNPDEALTAVFGKKYSRKPFWPKEPVTGSRPL